jgi:hypothetical protein
MIDKLPEGPQSMNVILRPDASTVPAYITLGGGGSFVATATINGVAEELKIVYEPGENRGGGAAFQNAN